ncbi:MAG TPA: amidohydrolase family protein [Candidatus Binatia bacterium]|nr:amidohydrolase family protein [Candidatus Binatia bacterium]
MKRRPKPNARKRGPAIDIHAHFVPEEFLRLIETEGEPHGVGLRRSPDGPMILVGQATIGPITAHYHNLELRLKSMDKQRVAVHALSLMPPMVYWADGSLGLRLARLVNDAMAEANRAYPDRFVFLATLPMQDPEAAVNEVNRAVTELGCRGIYLGTNVRGKELSDPSFLPVFERIHALRVPVFLHPLNVIGSQRLTTYYLHNLLGNPFDTAVAAANLIFSGLLHRFPKLNICLPHAGGALPYLIGRLNHGWKVRQECKGLNKPPTSYLRRFTYDTISHAPESLNYLIKLVGVDRVMMGSDYCFDMGYEHPVKVVTALKLSSGDQEKILGGNAKKLLQIR